MASRRDGYTPNIIADGNPDGAIASDAGKTHREDSQVDSGFLSGEVVDSEEFESEEKFPGGFSAGLDDEGDDPKGVASMRMDSGIIDDVADSLSSLNFKSGDGLNDLSSSRSIRCEPQPRTIEENWEIYYAQDENGDTFLHQAVEQFFPEVALAVIRAAPANVRPTLLNTENDYGQTALHLAVVTGQWRIARMLIVAGAKPSPRDRHGDTPLHVAARTGDLDCCKAITCPVQALEREKLDLPYHSNGYEECDLDQWNFDGQTCVHVATINRHLDVLQHLIWLGADINAREGKGGYTILHYAVQMDDDRLVRLLLNFKGLDVSVLTYGGRTPLELGYPVRKHVEELLKDRGVPSPDVSDADDDDYDSDDEMMYEPTSMLSNQSFAIGASA